MRKSGCSNAPSYLCVVSVIAASLFCDVSSRAQEAVGTGPQAAPAPAPSSSATSGGLQEVVVTAQKRSENLQQVPIAIRAVSGDALAQAGVADIGRLSTVVPGLDVSIVLGEFAPHLRGIGSQSTAPGEESPVATYIDGVYQPWPFDINFQDVTQVSVLYGPQGTLFGRNASGGVIQITTKDPQSTFAGMFQTSLDNYLRTTNNLYVTGGITDNLDANLSVQYIHQEDGWGKNLLDGAPIDVIGHDISLRSKWFYRMDDSTSIRFIFDYQNAKNNIGFNGNTYPGTASLDPFYVRSSNPWDTDEAARSNNTTASGGASVTITHDFSFARLTSISSYHEEDLHSTFSTGVPGPIESETVDWTNERSKEAQEDLQLTSLQNGPLKWTTGLYYFFEHGNSGPITLFVAPSTLITIPAGEGTQSVAGYGQATAEVLPATNLTMGLRYTYEHRNFNAQEFFGPLVGGIPLIPYVSERESFYKTTWRLALDHNFTDDVDGYVSYNRGFKSGGYNLIAPTNPGFAPEQVDAYELGVKSEFLDHRVRLNAAAFYNDYKNIQVTRFATTAIIINGAEANIYGFDLDAEALVTDNLHLTSGLQVQRAFFTNYPDAQFSTPLPSGFVLLTAGSATGKLLPYAPRVTFNLGMDYVVPLSFGDLDFNVTNEVNSGYFFEPDNVTRQQGFDMLDASVSWSSPDNRYSVKLWANNLFDRVVFSQEATQAIGYLVDLTNPPRTFGATLTVNFGGEATAPAYTPAPVPPAQAPAPPPAARIEAQREFQVFFDFDKSNITEAAANVIRAAADAIRAGNVVRITVTGHTDTVGTAAYNQALSERRASAVKRQLVADGVDAGGITTIGVGKRGLLVPTADGVREPQNRRAVIALQ